MADCLGCSLPRARFGVTEETSSSREEGINSDERLSGDVERRGDGSERGDGGGGDGEEGQAWYQ